MWHHLVHKYGNPVAQWYPKIPVQSSIYDILSYIGVKSTIFSHAQTILLANYMICPIQFPSNTTNVGDISPLFQCLPSQAIFKYGEECLYGVSLLAEV